MLTQLQLKSLYFKLFLTLIIAVVGFITFSKILPVAYSTAQELNTLPLGDLFGNGLFIIVMIWFLIMIVRTMIKHK